MQDINNLMLRLKKEREFVCKKLWELGYKDGIQDINEMSYSDIYNCQDYLECGAPVEAFDMYAPSQTLEKMKKLYEKDLDDIVNTHEIDVDQKLFLNLEDHMDIYCNGWTEGVLHIWGKVRQKLMWR